MRTIKQVYTQVVKRICNQALSRIGKQGFGVKAVLDRAVMTSPEVIFTICRLTTASPYLI